MSVWVLALKSLKNRWGTAALTAASLALSVALLLGVHRVHEGARKSFQSTLAGTDLLVGARSGPVQLLLYSVFRLGDPTNNMSWESYEWLRSQPDVRWSIPISLGDSHKGYRVVGTTPDYFKFYQYGENKKLAFRAGTVFTDLFQVVLGSQVAEQLGYGLGDKMILSHGIDATSFQDHKNLPFRVVGVLDATGTPVDRSLHVTLASIEAIHVGWESGAPPSKAATEEVIRGRNLAPEAVTAALVGLKSKMGIFALQREIQEYEKEALMAVLPGATFQQLWGTVSVAELALTLLSLMVVLTGLLGMTTSLLTTLNERRREMAILRSVGASPSTVFGLLVSEALALCVAGVVGGVGLLYLVLFSFQHMLEVRWGLRVSLEAPGAYDLKVMGLILLSGLLVGLFPAWRAYRRSLGDGLSLRV